ncbi:LPS export ABC transporter periplasmic protein LptC [Flexibacterium corallicola]|uniref:LPS export ABC transporter periplasmic protein LptC n=1 Tax=Flexibacterium corallicola TaxID=3037259 RepID=UPI00286FA73F|nr:LPS export ABC transporter periplasmic protein LptC [Pseudovibrio sp. M1P-2-3]
MQVAQPPSDHFSWGKRNEQKKVAAQKAARRHTLLVKILRFLLPTLGFLIAAFMVGMIIFQNIFSGIGIGAIKLSPDGLVMSNPHLSGSDGERSYTVKASEALQRLTNPDIIDLDNISAQINLTKEEGATVTASQGTYDAGGETLRLEKGVKVVYSKGYTAEFEYLDIDMKTGKIKTSDVVEVQSNGGMIGAGSMSFDQENDTLNFGDGVSMLLNPAAMENSQ